MSEEKECQPLEAGLELPGGIKLQTKGYHLSNVLQFVGVAIFALMAYMIWEFGVEMRKVSTAITAVATLSANDKPEHDKITRTIEKQTEAQEATSYILTLNQADRERLRLAMPEGLRRRHER
jgi:hypothetical protein